MIFLEIVSGLGAGLIFGLLSGLFNLTKNKSKHLLYLKGAWCLFISIGFVVVAEFTGFKGAKYIASLTFGYVSFRFWGEDKPSRELSIVWIFFKPFLFGCVGGGIDLSKIKLNHIGISVACISLGLIMRFGVSYFVTY